MKGEGVLAILALAPGPNHPQDAETRNRARDIFHARASDSGGDDPKKQQGCTWDVASSPASFLHEQILVNSPALCPPRHAPLPERKLAILGARPRAEHLFFDSSDSQRAYTLRGANVTRARCQAQPESSEFVWRYSHIEPISVSELRHAHSPSVAARPAAGGRLFPKPAAFISS